MGSNTTRTFTIEDYPIASSKPGDTFDFLGITFIHNGNYLSSGIGGANTLFATMGLDTEDKMRFFEGSYGYSSQGNWPQAKSLQDLDKSINNLYELIAGRTGATLGKTKAVVKIKETGLHIDFMIHGERIRIHGTPLYMIKRSNDVHSK